MDEAAPAGRPGLTKFIRLNVKTFGDRYVRKSRFIVRPLNHIRRHSLEQTITLVLAGSKKRPQVPDGRAFASHLSGSHFGQGSRGRQLFFVKAGQVPLNDIVRPVTLRLLRRFLPSRARRLYSVLAHWHQPDAWRFALTPPCRRPLPSSLSLIHI